MTEYVLVVAGVVVALVIALGPSGFLTRKIGDTMNLAMTGTKCVALQTCFDPEGCPTVCGNDCCEPGESISNCPADCSLCMSDADCDDGVACNGAEWCDPMSGCQPGGLTCSSCTGPDGSVIVHGGSKTYYESATVPFETNCVSESRVCYDGTLSGSYTETSCSVSAAADCGPVPHLGSAKFYQSATVPCGDSCVWEMRDCYNGTLSGSYTAASCVEVCTDCIGPDSVVIPNGGSRIYYQAAQEECWTVCNQEARSCVDGVLSGSFTASSCTVTTCDDGIACTDDTCETNLSTNFGCVFTPNDSLCDDGISCTGTDNPGALPTPRNSPAGFGDDWCDASGGCQFIPHNEWCDDGVDCTLNVCDTTLDCQNPPDHAYCDDGVGCTDDWCDTVADCQNNPNDAHCTAVGECADGVCHVTLDCQYTPNDTNCDDSIGCTDDWCDGSFMCHNDPNDANCDDGVDCTTNMCNPVTDCQYPPDHAYCDDGVGCTDDLCNTVTGCQNNPNDGLCTATGECAIGTCHAVADCQYTPNNGYCNDGVACTDDVCNSSFVCVSTPNDGNCPDDGISCTNDYCDAVTGCQYPPDDSKCDDGDACTTDKCNPIAGCEHLSCCLLPEGGTIPHGASKVYYLQENAPCGGVCNWQTRLCTDGSLSGWYTHPACGPEICADCTGPDGTLIPHGTSKTYYLSSGEPCTFVCSSQSRLCTDGSLSGSYTFPSCMVCAVGMECGNGVCDVYAAPYDVFSEDCESCPEDCGACGGVWVSVGWSGCIPCGPMCTPCGDFVFYCAEYNPSGDDCPTLEETSFCAWTNIGCAGGPGCGAVIEYFECQ